MKTLLIITVVLLSSCTSQNPQYIQGYVFNKKHNPVMGIRIQDPDNRNLVSYTNTNGYFKINQMIKGDVLYVFDNGEKIDSIYIATTHPERGVTYNFVEGRNDTLFVDLEKQNN